MNKLYVLCREPRLHFRDNEKGKQSTSIRAAKEMYQTRCTRELITAPRQVKELGLGAVSCPVHRGVIDADVQRAQ